MQFSVLISVFFKENPAFLDESLKSIENQTLCANEIVLVKDGPLTIELNDVIAAHQIKSKIPYKIVDLSENVGLGVALNEGLSICQYQWVARMDSDDISILTRFEKQFKYLSEHDGIDVLGASILEFRDTPEDALNQRIPPNTSRAIIQYAKYRNPMNHMSVVFRKEAVLDVDGYVPMNGFEDYYLWIRLLKQGNRFANIKEPLVNARVGNNMIGRRHGIKYIKNEVNFAIAAWQLGFLSLYEMIRNIIIRAVPRLLPVFVLEKLYNFLRK